MKKEILQEGRYKIIKKGKKWWKEPSKPRIIELTPYKKWGKKLWVRKSNRMKPFKKKFISLLIYPLTRKIYPPIRQG